jgi:hypothetical protein
VEGQFDAGFRGVTVKESVEFIGGVSVAVWGFQEIGVGTPMEEPDVEQVGHQR